jgi:hypothetical protein
MVIRSPIPEALLKELEQRFPDCAPDLKWTDREVWFKAGQASVCSFLREQRQQQQETLVYGELS